MSVSLLVSDILCLPQTQTELLRSFEHHAEDALRLWVTDFGFGLASWTLLGLVTFVLYLCCTSGSVHAFLFNNKKH